MLKSTLRVVLLCLKAIWRSLKNIPSLDIRRCCQGTTFLSSIFIIRSASTAFFRIILRVITFFSVLRSLPGLIFIGWLIGLFFCLLCLIFHYYLLVLCVDSISLKTHHLKQIKVRKPVN